MELITKNNITDIDNLTKLRGRLNIHENDPKLFTFGTIIDFDSNMHDIRENKKYYVCVYKVGIGRAYWYKKKAIDE